MDILRNLSGEDYPKDDKWGDVFSIVEYAIAVLDGCLISYDGGGDFVINGEECQCYTYWENPKLRTHYQEYSENIGTMEIVTLPDGSTITVQDILDLDPEAYVMWFNR